MKQQVRIAIDFYEKEIAGGVQESNTGDIVTRALQQAREQYDAGKSRQAQETLRRAMEDMRQERDRCEQGVKTLGERRRDMALAAYDGEAAAQAIIEMAEALYGGDRDQLWIELRKEKTALSRGGSELGSNVHLFAAIAVSRKLLSLARNPRDRSRAGNWLGNALASLGERQSSTALLQEAAAIYRTALKECEHTPIRWAGTQNNLGLALLRLGELEASTAQLEEAIVVFRQLLEKLTGRHASILWSAAQNNLGIALCHLGTREQQPQHLARAVIAFCAALEIVTRSRNPLMSAKLQIGLGAALADLGQLVADATLVQWAVEFYRAGIGELNSDSVPFDWATANYNLGNALGWLGTKASNFLILQEAIDCYQKALTKWKRGACPLQWAATQNNLGKVQKVLGELEIGTERLENAVSSFICALEEFSQERDLVQWANSKGNQGMAMLAIAAKTNDCPLASLALAQLETAETALREGGREAWSITFRNQIPAAKALIARLTAASGAEAPPPKPGALQRFLSAPNPQRRGRDQ